MKTESFVRSLNRMIAKGLYSRLDDDSFLIWDGLLRWEVDDACAENME